MLEYSDDAKSAKSALFAEYNGIDIYVEDTHPAYKKIYLLLMQRLFEGKYIIDEIFPLGPRINVIHEYKNNLGKVDRTSVYIVDGDLYLLGIDGGKVPDGIYVLPFYCIENIFLDELAVIDICDEEFARIPKEEIEARYSFSTWLHHNRRLLSALFIEYAIANSLVANIQTVNYPINQLRDVNSGHMCATRIRDRIKSLRSNVIHRVGDVAYFSRRKEVISHYRSSGLDPEDIVSGKHFWLPLITAQMGSIDNINVSKDALKVRMIKKTSLEKISDIMDYVLNE